MRISCVHFWRVKRCIYKKNNKIKIKDSSSKCNLKLARGEVDRVTHIDITEHDIIKCDTLTGKLSILGFCVFVSFGMEVNHFIATKTHKNQRISSNLKLWLPQISGNGHSVSYWSKVDKLL